MNRPSFFAPLWLSWAPGAYYRDLARHGRGGGVAWLFVLTLFTSAVMTWTVTRSFNQWRTVELSAAMDELEKGEASEPIEVRDPDSQELVAVLLPAAGAAPPEYSQVPFVFLRDRLVTHGGGLAQLIGEVNYADKGIELKRERIEVLAHRVARIIPWVLFPSLMALWFPWRIFLWLMLSMAAVIANSAFGAGLRYGALLRVTAAAMTPASLLIAACAALGVHVPFWFTLALAGTVLLIVFAVRAAGAPPPVGAPPASNGPVAPPSAPAV